MSGFLDIQPSGLFEGNDGNWSTFLFSVGSPAQTFRGLPTVLGSETWVPWSGACPEIMGNRRNCAESRGAESGLFMPDNSDTWDALGPYGLTDEAYLFGGDDSGSYGTDSIALNTSAGPSAANISTQPVAAYSSPNFWLGMFGLGRNETSFGGPRRYPSLLKSLKENGLIERLSFGYFAGQSYTYPKALASLTLGGYNLSRIQSEHVKVDIDPQLGTMKLGVQSMFVSNSLNDSRELMPDGGLEFQIDTATAQMWLPKKVCDAFASAYGLTFDADTNYYIVNETIHQKLTNQMPRLDIFIGMETSGGQKVGITFPYSAFDMTIGLPYYPGGQRYFPIRRAANESQYVLGRVFLQETYLAVDWENNNFTIGKGSPRPETDPGLIPTSPTPNPTAVSSSKSGTDSGLIAGISVGVVALLTVLASSYWYWRRRHRQQDHSAEDSPPVIGEYFTPKERESEAEKARRDTIGSQDVVDAYGTLPRYEATPTEIHAPHGHTMLMSNEILEMEGDCISRELRSAEEIRASLEQLKKKSTNVTVTEVE